MKTLLALLFVILSVSVLSQTSLTVVDAETLKPIPYAKVILSGDFRNAEQNGNVMIYPGEKVKEVKAFNYKSYIPASPLLGSRIQLEPVKKEITNEVNLPSLQNMKRKKLGKIDFSTTAKFLGSNADAVGVYRFFSQSKMKGPHYISKITFLSEVEGKSDANIYVVLYKSEKGKPAAEFWKSFIVNCANGKRLTTLDLSQNPLLLPDEGVFVGFDWIKDSRNITYSPSKMQSNSADPKVFKNSLAQPFIYYQEAKSGNNWILVRDQWRNLSDSGNTKNQLAITLELIR